MSDTNQPNSASPVPMQESVGMQAVLDAQAAAEIAWRATELASNAMMMVMRRKFPIGTVIDKRKVSKETPQEWRSFSTLRGKDHGTRIFRIESDVTVDLNASAPELSMWDCEATPISEKTGLDMNGAARGHTSRPTVTLRGNVFNLAGGFDLEGAPYAEFCISLVRDFFAGKD